VRHLGLRDCERCSVPTLPAVPFTACSRAGSPSACCWQLKNAPCHETAREALRANLRATDGLERRLNRALAARVSRPLRHRLRRRRRAAAVDLPPRPHHGKPLSEDGEVVRGQAKGGTSHSHAYATA
jgi:hypothetical protein